MVTVTVREALEDCESYRYANHRSSATHDLRFVYDDGYLPGYRSRLRLPRARSARNHRNTRRDFSPIGIIRVARSNTEFQTIGGSSREDFAANVDALSNDRSPKAALLFSARWRPHLRNDWFSVSKAERNVPPHPRSRSRSRSQTTSRNFVSHPFPS